MAQLLLTKLHPPPVRASHLARERLLRRLDEALAHRLTLVAAPAGYGKTTLLTGWLAERAPTYAWLSLDEGDNALERFLRHLVAALQEVDPTLEALGDFVGEDGADVGAVTTTLLNDLLENEEPLLLVLDDYHLIENPDVHRALAVLITQAPPLFHTLISTRTDPPLPLARWRAGGDLVEIRGEDLRFGAAEARELLFRLGLDLTPSEADALTLRTEGWAAGLHLAALSLRGRGRPSEVRDLIERFTGSDRFVLDYLTEEVLMRQPQPWQDFLLLSSVLDSFSADLAAAVTGFENAQELIDELGRDDVFLVPLDEERDWYRYHGLFRDLLRYRLESARPDMIPRLHRLASDWFAADRHPADALRHALLAGDYPRGAAVLEAHPRGARARRAVLDFLGEPDEGASLDALLERAVAAGIALEQRGRLFELLEDDDVAATAPGWLEPLSDRESEVLELIAAGLSNKGIAERLGISPNTVKTHARNAYEKLNVRSRTEAVRRARELGLV